MILFELTDKRSVRDRVFMFLLYVSKIQIVNDDWLWCV